MLAHLRHSMALALLAFLLMSCQGNNPADGGASRIDTLYIGDTTGSPLIIVVDTLFVIDSSYNVDTLLILDTTYRADTLITYDTTYAFDSVFRIDTIYSFDTVIASSSQWSDVVDSVRNASYMIALRFEADGELSLVGSGSAIDNATIITNAHVFVGLLAQYILYKQYGFSVTPVAVRNGSYSTSVHAVPLDIGGIHSQYVDSTVYTYDIGYFKTAQSLSYDIELPPDDTIRGIKVGQSIGTLGFPGETSQRISHIANATFKDGVISSLSPFEPSASPNPFNTLMVQHNFNTTPGTSGSPIFDCHGRLVAVHNSGVGQLIWNDAIGDFTVIYQGAIGYGIRADVVNDMFTNGTVVRDTISTWYIPKRYRFWPGSRICLADGTKPVYVGTTMASAQTAANSLFGKAAPDYTAPDGSLWYSDYCSYSVWLLRSSISGNMWSVAIAYEDSKIYAPSFRDMWGIAVGTSRSFILNTYGYNYTNAFSTDSTHYYYNYSTLGVGFGFDLYDPDWNCDMIQIAESGSLQKTASRSLPSCFPNLGRPCVTPRRKAQTKVIEPEITRICR